MLKKYKKSIIKQKITLLKINKLIYIKKSIIKNLNKPLYLNNINNKLQHNLNNKQICLLSGKQKALTKRLNLHRSITNALLQFNFIPNITNLKK